MQKTKFSDRLRSWLLALVLLSAGTSTAVAQSLAELTPAGSLLTIGFWEDAKAATSLKDELLTLDWEAGAETFRQLAEAMGMPDDLAMFWADSDELALDFCPAARDLIDGEDYTGSAYRGLFSVGFSPFNPLPAATVLLELEDSQAELVSAAIDALLDCAGDSGMVEVHELEQDGVPFAQIVVDYELNASYSLNDGILALSSSADQLRQVLRLQAGSGEPSLADSRLYTSWQELERGFSGIDWLLDYTVLAELAESFGPSFDAPELASRLGRSFRTAGGSVGSLSFHEGELVYVNQLLPDAAAGDTELFDLLLSTGLELSGPPLLPANGVLVSSQLMNVQGFFSYLQSWLDELGQLIGEPLDLHELAAMAGIDLQTVLLDWIGNDVHVVQLEPSFTLGNLLGGADQLVLIGTHDAAAAEAGFAELLGLVQMFTELEEDIDLGFDSRPDSWRGVDYTRVRMGPINDFGYALLDDHLVIGTPVRVLRQAIDLHLDGGSADRPDAFSRDVVSVYNYDASRELSSAAQLLASGSQPLAFIMRNSALEEVESARWRDDGFGGGTRQDWSWGSSYGTVDLSEVTLQPLRPGETLTHNLTDTFDTGGTAWFELPGISAGDRFSVRMESADGDSMLELIEIETGEVKAYNDDYEWPSLHAQIDFIAAEGRTYAVSASFYGMPSEFTIQRILAVDEEAAEVPELEAPTFSALLDMFDLVPQAIDIVADRTGSLEGFQERRGDTIYTRYVLQADW